MPVDDYLEDQDDQSSGGRLVNLVTNYPMPVAVGVITFSFIVIVLFLTIPWIRNEIRNDEIASTFSSSYLGNEDKIHVIKYGELNKVLKEQKRVVLFFARPDLSDYSKIEALLNKRVDEKYFPENLYIYPIVYDKEDIMKRYDLTDKQTFILIEDSTEMNRIVIENDDQIKTALIKQLNDF